MAKQKFNFNASNRILGIGELSAPNSQRDTSPSAPGAPNSQREASPSAPSAPNSQRETSPSAPGAPNSQRETSPSAPGALEMKKTPQRMELRYIPRRKIRTNKKNNYPMSDLDSLEESILQYGLQQPMTVMYIMEEDKYVLEAGHRRCTILDRLIDTYKDFDNEDDENYLLYLQNVKPYEVGYPCIVTDRLNEDVYYDVPDEELSEKAIDSEIRLIITNEEVRSTSTQVKAQNVQRLTELYTLKNIGKKHHEKINVKEQIAKDIGLKPRQVATYQAVNTLIPELKDLFDFNNITLKEGSNYASLSEDEQMEIFYLINAGHKVSEADVKAIKQEKQDMEKKFSATIQQMENNLQKKEMELASLKETLEQTKSSVTDSEDYKQLQDDKYEMEETILELRNEILALQNKQKQEKPKLDETSFMEKLKVKAAYEQAYKSVEEFKKLCDNYIVNNKAFTEEYEALVNNLNTILKGE